MGFFLSIRIYIFRSLLSWENTIAKYSRMEQVKFVKGNLEKMVLGPLLNTLT